ncbi:LPS export ABC transporter permease LptF [Sphingomonas segetis]|uniref:LPS export ABC transporter permease LptF n=1 Tax=Sphingomonas segetis TaxID=1104779 RepID=UPI001E5F3CC3|nr:LPS export ABC transporter permease LptF [Sphingomonas segetis]
MPAILPRLRLVDSYLARSIAVPLIGTLVLAAMLLLLDKMLRLFQYVVDAGGPVSVVWRMLANLLPEYLSLGIPIGLMLGILLAFRKLALSSELDALRGIGVGYGRLLRVPYGYTVPLAIINLLIVGYLQPYTEYKYENLRFDLKSGALGAAIKVGEFNQLGRRLTLRIERSEKNGTQLHGIFVETEDGKGMSVAATAQHGRFLATDDPDTILFRLIQGRLVQQSPRFTTPRTLAFEVYDLPVSLPAIDQFRRRGGAESDELYLHELWRMGYGGGPATRHQQLEAQAHFNFRLVEVLMMFILPLLAVALAVPPKRSTSGLGIFIAILVVVAYHKVNQYGQQAAANGQINPILALWVPLVLFAGIIFWMYHVLAHHPGGQPIGALERFFAKVARVARSMLPKPKAPAEGLNPVPTRP